MIRHHTTRERGFTLVEVLVALAIMATGVLVIATVFPKTLEATTDAQTLTIAAGLAQMKAEEIRRDNDQNSQMIDQIKARTTPTDPIAFPRQPNLAYSFCGRSLVYTDASDPRGAPGVPRVIIRYAPEFRKSQDVIYELRFDQTNP